jgi:hypothetical protein
MSKAADIDLLLIQGHSFNAHVSKLCRYRRIEERTK